MRPFHDRPDVAIPVVWYPVPGDRPRVPPTVFRPHWWEIRDQYTREGVGTPPHEDWTTWSGPYPQAGLLPLLGSEREWAEGVSHAAFLTGGLPGADRCFDATAGPWIRPVPSHGLVERLPNPPMPVTGECHSYGLCETEILSVLPQATASFGLCDGGSVSIMPAEVPSYGMCDAEASTTTVEETMSFGLVEQLIRPPETEDAPSFGLCDNAVPPQEGGDTMSFGLCDDV